MNYKLAKELKDAGFTQVGEGTYLEGNIESDETGIITTNSVYVPTLSELIEACGALVGQEYGNSPQFILSSKSGGNWGAEWRLKEVKEGYGSTPEEAVAQLWLVLNKK